MLRKPSPVYNRLLDRVREMPVIDCHEHIAGPDNKLTKTYTEPIAALTVAYFVSDLWASGASDREIALIQSEEATTDEKWPVFSRLWAATEHTAYARVTKLVLKEVYDIDKLTREALDCVAEQLAKRDRSYYMKIVEDAGIKAILADVLKAWDPPVKYFAVPPLGEYLAGQFPMPEIWHPVFPLPFFHEIRRREFIDWVGFLSDLEITSLAEYEEAVFELIRKSKDLGVIALKDQSAYRRVIAYDLPARGDAERILNRLLIDPRSQLA